jgi:hypothetical protein
MRTCTLDEASARKVAIGLGERQRYETQDAMDRLPFPTSSTSRLKFLREVQSSTRKVLGDRILWDGTTKRVYTSMYLSLDGGELYVNVDQIRYAEMGRHVPSFNTALVINKHATARLLQRLGTNDFVVVCKELRPIAPAVLTLTTRGVPEGRVARIPTLSGHLVIPHAPDGILHEAVTFCTDTGSGDEKLQAIQNARRLGGYITSADRAIKYQEGLQ